MDKTRIVIEIVIVVVVLVFAFCLNPSVRSFVNQLLFDVQKADDATSYSARRQVEDTARAMISSYQSDVLMYNQYKDSVNPEEQSWAAQAKMRANRTASTYNNYILGNSFVWKDNIPNDIERQLETID